MYKVDTYFKHCNKENIDDLSKWCTLNLKYSDIGRKTFRYIKRTMGKVVDPGHSQIIQSMGQLSWIFFFIFYSSLYFLPRKWKHSEQYIALSGEYSWDTCLQSSKIHTLQTTNFRYIFAINLMMKNNRKI